MLARDPREVRRELEQGIGSRGRLRIIAALASRREEALSRYVLEKKTGIRSNFLDSDLKALLEIGWVEEVRESERLRKYRLNLGNETLLKVLEFLWSVGYTIE